jgi:predicted Zn-ribbon and HTH transcriptional regulator
MTSNSSREKISELIREKKYDLAIANYMRQQPIFNGERVVDDAVRSKTLRSILNQTAVFLGVDCEKCGVELVDPTGGVLTKKNKRHARCGRCGYACLVSRHIYRII